MMKEYWFIIDAYVFLWSNSKEIVIYNTLSGKGLLFPYSVKTDMLVKALQNKDNLYCISVNESDLSDPDIKEFVYSLRENFCADLLCKSSFPKKPIVVVPEININEDVDREPASINNSKTFGENVIKNLTDIIIELTGQCSLSCSDCNSTYKQIPWCNKQTEILSIDKVKSILQQIKYTTVFDLRFVGGDVFSYPYWSELIIELEKITCKKNFYIHYLLLNKHKLQLELLLKESDNFLKILVDQPYSLMDNCDMTFLSGTNVEYIFKITSVEEYDAASNLIEEYGLNAKILPFYTGKNNSFFEEYIYQTREDILNMQWKKNEIFANQILNTNDFGKLTLQANGDIYANINFDSIGKSDDNLRQLVHNELKTGTSWRRTRDLLDECKGCVYKYLCPSPSNYELAMKRNNLCHVK